MIKRSTFILTLTSMMLCANAYSQLLIPQSLPIEAKTNYYLRENLECREVVSARDSVIQNLRMYNSLQEKAIKISQTQIKIANRLTANYIDSVEALNSSLDKQILATEKQINRKRNWRKATAIESILLIGIGFVTYIRLAL